MKLDAAIAAGDIVALEALAGAKGEPAFTAAGLPVSVLAKWKLVELSGDIEFHRFRTGRTR